MDFLFPVFAFGDTLPIDPGVQLVCGQGIYDLLGEGQVFARVGNEDMRHIAIHPKGSVSLLVRFYKEARSPSKRFLILYNNS
jgi:hypothetical protein